MAVMSINFDINDFKSNFHTNDILSDKVDFYLKSNIEENISEPENLDYLEKVRKVLFYLIKIGQNQII